MERLIGGFITTVTGVGMVTASTLEFTKLSHVFGGDMFTATLFLATGLALINFTTVVGLTAKVTGAVAAKILIGLIVLGGLATSVTMLMDDIQSPRFSNTHHTIAAISAGALILTGLFILAKAFF